MADNSEFDVKPEDIDEQDRALDLFEELVSAGNTIDNAVRATLEAFPNQAALIGDYAFSQVAVSEIDGMEDTAGEERIMARADALLAARLGVSSPIKGVLDAARARGLDLPALSRTLGLARSIIVKLDRRLINAASVPSAALARIASEIGCAAADLRVYLSSPPTLSAGASYRSKTAPDLADSSGDIPREPFEHALSSAQASGEMQPEDVHEWLKD